MGKIAFVFFNDCLVGHLFKEDPRGDNQFIFKYDRAFLEAEDNFPIGYNFPLTSKEFSSKKLFAFFESLASEGWLLKLQSQNSKIDERDFFSMLLENGEELIGGIKIRKA